MKGNTNNWKAMPKELLSSGIDWNKKHPVFLEKTMQARVKSALYQCHRHDEQLEHFCDEIIKDRN